MKKAKLSIREVVGGNYARFWNFRGRYRVIKGSRASKKSKTTAIWYIAHMMKHPEANLLVVRKTFRTLKDSCFTELKWAINRLGVEQYWKITESPLELTYIPTGQKIYFRGLDDPLKVTSITVTIGYLCWCWIEEAYEISKESDFDMLDESIRGQVPKGLFKQITLTLNPWNERHWIKKRFFDIYDDDILAKTTNYMCNEFLDKADLKVFETMKKNNPSRYKVAGLGEWGISEGLIYDGFNVDKHVKDLIEFDYPKYYVSCDYGTLNATVFILWGYFKDTWYATKEYYYSGRSNGNKKTDNQYADDYFRFIGDRKIQAMIVDPSAASFITELEQRGVSIIKADNSVIDGIRFTAACLDREKIIIGSKCVKTIEEFGLYVWDSKHVQVDKPISDNDHCMDALRYFCYTILAKQQDLLYV